MKWKYLRGIAEGNLMVTMPERETNAAMGPMSVVERALIRTGVSLNPALVLRRVVSVI